MSFRLNGRSLISSNELHTRIRTASKIRVILDLSGKTKTGSVSFQLNPDQNKLHRTTCRLADLNQDFFVLNTEFERDRIRIKSLQGFNSMEY